MLWPDPDKPEPKKIKFRKFQVSYKLEASPQLEWWNAGILEKWVLGYCNIG
jgi:hypothetical protein